MKLKLSEINDAKILIKLVKLCKEYDVPIKIALSLIKKKRNNLKNNEKRINRAE